VNSLSQHKGRPTIALQINQIEYGYAAKLWPGAADAAARRDVNLLIFPGRNLNAPHNFEYQYNAIYQFINKHNVDALVMVSTILCNFISEEQFRRYYQSFKGLPVVSIGIELPGIPSLVIDNKNGIRQIVRHLIDVHGHRRIAFVKGPDGNKEAAQRFQAYQEVLDEKGIAFDPKLIGSGDFNWSSTLHALEELFSNKPGKIDAIVFANDEMASTGMRYLKKQGYEIPGDFAVTGFDDVEEAEYEAPPITTVRQPLYEQAKKALEMAVDLIEGRQVPPLIELPTEMVVRTSCGCLPNMINRIMQVSASKEISGSPPGSDRRWPSFEEMLNGIKLHLGLDSQKLDDLLQGIHAVYNGLLELIGGLGEARRPDDNLIRDFLGLLNQVLINEVQSSRDISLWQIIFHTMLGKIRDLRPELKAGRAPELLLDRTSIVIGEMSRLRQGSLRIEEFWQSVVLRNIIYDISSILDLEELMDSLAEQLPKLEIGSCIVTQYEKEWEHLPNTAWRIPPTHHLLLYFDKTGKKDLQGDRSRPFSSSRLIPQNLLSGTGRLTLVVYPLFFRNIHFGNILYEVSSGSSSVLETLTTQISSIIKSILLFNAQEDTEKKLKKALSELEDYTEILNRISITDDLTGLYNRRGFLKLAKQSLSLAKRMGKPGLIFYADLDGLKNINDLHGHEEGDWAIRQTAEILKKTFRKMDIIARMGGDEFIVLAVDATSDLLQTFERRIEEQLDACNAAGRKPYSLSISIGGLPFRAEAGTTIEELVKKADLRLYRRKKHKK
jgi:diguanylate cyclase (GGDEF)-like protein